VDLISLRIEVPGDDKSIPTVVPFTTANDNGPMYSQLDKPSRASRASILHQRESRYAEFLNRSAVQIPDELA
jgi:hypothetical protein